LLYELAHGDAHEAATLASAVTRTGDYFAAHLDNKPPTAPRITRFAFSGQPPRVPFGNPGRISIVDHLFSGRYLQSHSSETPAGGGQVNCPRCQHENPADMSFCGECGTRLVALCSACGTVNAPTNKFCGKCGATLTQGVPAARFASPETYTPKHLAAKILTPKSALEGERKLVTVLFADLKGSMELLADRDPEEARKILDPVLDRMMEAVHRYEGTVNQVMGDGIMALFGAPVAHEDHAMRACYSALRMQESVRRYAEEARRAHAVNVQIRIGLNSGEVVVRAIGSDLHMDYTAVGQTTHLAARMEQLASPGSIVLASATLELAEGYVAVKPLGPVPVRGVADPVEVYEVTGTGPARTRLQTAARRGLTHFVGRDTELSQLRRAQQLASAGHGQLVAVVGEAGVGKSRLVYEFTHSHRMQGWLVLEGVGVSYGKAASYLPVIDLLKSYFKIQDRDGLREIREKVTGKLLTLDEALKATLPALLALLDVPVDDVSWQALDSPQRRQRTLDAVRRLLLREAREQAVLLIVEDLHWIDGETQALLDGLADSLESAPLLLLVNYRPEYRHAWGGKTCYSQIRLHKLPAARAGELLDALLGDDPGLAPLKRLLVKRGNPFFLEETVQTLVETKALVGERGRYRLTRPVQAIQVPATVQAMLAARIDRLPPEDKRLLQVASVIGKDVPFALLQAIAELSDEALCRGLDHLQAAEFLYETGLFPDLEYSFKHALIQDVTYRGLMGAQRRELHARIVAALETLCRDRLGEQIERLAYHALRADLGEQAVPYLRQAGLKAAARSVLHDARAWFEQALGVLEAIPESQSTLEQAFEIRLELRPVLNQLGEVRQQLERLREAEALAERLNDERRRGRVYAFITNVHSLLGELDEALASGTRALAIARRLGNLELRILVTTYLEQVQYFRGEYERLLKGDWAGARSLIERGIVAFRTANVVLALPSAIACSAWALAQLGEASQALDRLREGEQLLELAAATGIEGLAYHALGRACLLLGRLDDARRLGDRVIEALPSQLGFVSQALHLLGDIATHPNRFDAERGEALYRRARALADARGMRPLVAHCHLGLGKLYRRTGQADQAQEHLTTATTMYREMDMRFWLEKAEVDLPESG
jgi:class 3 adenylate cyclase/tetratricopeptide (TPR) repeat protein